MEELEYISHVNIPGCSGEQQSTIVETVFNVCVCCLSENVPLVRLANCKHVEFFDCSLKIKLEYSATVVCYACHGMLKNIYLFKRQVETSLLKLNQQVQNLQPNMKLSKLETSDIEIFHTYNSEPIEKEVIKAKPDIEIKTEIKIEFADEYSDPENDVPLSEIKENKERKQKKVAKEKDPNTPFFLQKYGGKIKIVTLSEKEMWEDRKREASKEKYLKMLYKCENCIVGYDHELTLKEHMEKRHNPANGGYPCAICKSVQISIGSFQQHMRRHYRRIDCSVCGARYSAVMSALSHYSQTHAAVPTQYKCEKCDYTTLNHRRFRYHRDSHKQRAKCEQCGKMFVNNSGLKVHMYTVHKTSSRVYSCSECPKTYRQRSGLLSHAESAHAPRGPAPGAGAGAAPGARAAYCAPCRTHFRTLHNLKHHLNTHSRHTSENDKKCVCSVCDARFLTKAQLKEHVDWEHLKTTNHKCDECNKVFKNGTKLKRHINYVHEKKRPPRNKMCDHCGRGFTTMAILRAHIRTHTGERPHACAHCAATFAHSAALYTHTKLLHSQKAAG